VEVFGAATPLRYPLVHDRESGSGNSRPDFALLRCLNPVLTPEGNTVGAYSLSDSGDAPKTKGGIRRRAGKGGSPGCIATPAMQEPIKEVKVQRAFAYT
jgi:hypothetical protein